MRKILTLLFGNFPILIYFISDDEFTDFFRIWWVLVYLLDVLAQGLECLVITGIEDYDGCMATFYVTAWYNLEFFHASCVPNL